MNNNNRNNTFIPNPQDLWNHPDIYSLNVNNQSNSNGGQLPPFTAHQQVQQLQQGQYPMYSVGYTTTAPNNLQGSFNPMFSQAWEGLDGGNNGSGMQMNYSYQQVNSCYPNQHQQILQPHMMQQIVSQSPRVVPLPLETPHFVPFSMNLSPSGPMAPFSLSSSASIHSAPVSINSGSFNSSQMVHFTNSPSPPKMHVPLNSRSSVTPTPVAHNMSLNSRSATPLVPLSFSSQSSSPVLNSRSFANVVPLPLNSQSSGSMAPLSFNSRSSNSSTQMQIPFSSSFSASALPINFNSRSSTPMSNFVPNCMSPKIPVSLNSHSPASMTSFSTNSSPSPPAPPPPKKPPRSRKKKSPMRPLPVNPSTLPLPIERSPPLPLYLNRSSGLITSNVNSSSWPPVLSHLSAPNVPVIASRVSTGMPLSAHLSSPTVTTAVNRLFPMAPLPAHQSSHTTPMSVHRSPPMVPVSAHLPAPMVPLSGNRSSHALPVSTNLFPLAPMPINRSSSASPIPPASFNPSPPRMPLPTNASPPAPMLHRRNPSPPKTNLQMSRLSVLHYAPERTETSNSHDEMENVHVFHEEEILKLVGVGEISDQSAELQRINPIHELNLEPEKVVSVKTEVNDTTSISSWEQNAFKGAANSPPGDEDLETELKRFYCPPSPPKSSDAKRLSTDPETTSSSSTSCTTTVSNTQTTIGGNRRKSTPKLVKVEPKGSPKKSPGQSKTSKGFIELSSDDDDDLKVVYFKPGDKKRRAPPRREVPPKKGQVQSRGRGQNPKNSEIKAVTSPSPGRYTAVEHKMVGSPTANKPMDPRLKAIARPAYPNGRYVAVAPRSTVPIPPRNQGPSNSKSNKSDPLSVIHPRSVMIKRTARKSTAPLPSGFSLQMITARKSTAPIPQLPLGKKATARKSTAPIPKTVTRSTGLPKSSQLAQPEVSYPLYAIASSSRSQRTTRSRASSRAINSVQKLNEESDPHIVLRRLSPEDLDTYLQRPPIKMKFSLVGSKGNTNTRQTARNAKGGQLRGQQSPSPSPNDKKIPNSRGRPRGRPPSNSQSKAESPSDVKTKTDRKNTTAQQLGEKSIGSDDDLLIVKEYLADSDESLDWEGERDEASSESELEPESELDSDDNTGVSKESQNIDDTANQNDTVDKKPINSLDSGAVESDEGESKEKLAEAAGSQNSFGDQAKAPKQTEDTSESSESECEEIGSKQATVIKSFEAPKPKVIIKGTKEDADKAVNNLRDILAQLNKNKTLNSLFRK